MRQSELFDQQMFPPPKWAGGVMCAAKGLKRSNLGRWLYIYVVASDRKGPSKIGVSHNVDKRLVSLRAENPAQLSVHYAAAVWPPRVVGVCEQYVHQVLADRRVHGEWFDLPPACAGTIVEMAMVHISSYAPEKWTSVANRQAAITSSSGVEIPGFEPGCIKHWRGARKAFRAPRGFDTPAHLAAQRAAWDKAVRSLSGEVS